MTDDATFIDANVLLEAILRNRPSAQAARDYMGTRSTIASPLSAHLMIYFGRKDGLEQNFLIGLLSQLKFTDFSTAEITWASKHRQDNDFEDALQVACAVLNHCPKMATFDKKLAKNYQRFIPIELLT